MSQTTNQEIQLRVGAEDIATLGYQEPQLVLGELGGFALMNKEGKNKTIVNFSDTIRQAWSQLLQTLQERNIPIPDLLRSPRFTPVSQDLSAGIFLFPDRIEVSAWGVEFDGTENWSYNNSSAWGSGSYAFKIDLNGGLIDGKCMLLSYAKSDGDSSINNGEDKVFFYGKKMFYGTMLVIADSAYTDLAAWKSHIASLKAAGTPIQVLYQLAEPITIPLDTPLDSHLTLHNASDYDVWIPLSEDGQEMYEYIPDYEGTGTHVYHWNREWVRAVGHQPVALEILDHGWTDRLNAAFLRNLRADYTQLRKDFDEYKQSHP